MKRGKENINNMAHVNLHFHIHVVGENIEVVGLGRNRFGWHTHTSFFEKYYHS
jgi:hypothetical protein